MGDSSLMRIFHLGLLYNSSTAHWRVADCPKTCDGKGKAFGGEYGRPIQNHLAG